MRDVGVREVGVRGETGWCERGWCGGLKFIVWAMQTSSWNGNNTLYTWYGILSFLIVSFMFIIFVRKTTMESIMYIYI